MEIDPSSQTRRAHNYLENAEEQNNSQNESNIIDTIQNFPLLASEETSHT